jgi:hypothetical protein
VGNNTNPFQKVVLVKLPASFEVIGPKVFYNCKDLRTIEFPASLKTVSSYAFWQSGLESVVFNEGLEKIGAGKYGGFEFANHENAVTKITKVAKLPSTLKTLGTAVFYDNAFTEIDLSATQIKTINDWAFMDCTALETVKFPATLETVRDEAFKNTGLETLVVYAAAPPQITGARIPAGLAAVYVPDGSVAAYQAAANWSAYAGIIKGLSAWTGK